MSETPLFVRQGVAPDSVIIRGARVVDPVEGVDQVLDVRVDGGLIAELGERISAIGHREVDGSGLTLAPAFVDPHVHLRVPGREDEETVASGSAAAAAGGFCAILAMPNTDPVVDSAAVLGALVEQALNDAVIPVGFMASITKGLRGEELSEMAELAATGAAAFTDDGRPVVSAGMLRRALQYAAVTGRRIALHEEEPTLSGKGQMHEGAVSAELGFTGWPSIGESVMIARDLAICAYEGTTVHIQHISAWESVAELRRWQELGVAATGEASPHHLVLTDEAVRSLDSNMKMNPPLRAERDRQALIEGLKDGTLSCIATDHAPHARHEKEAPFEEAPFGVTGLETAFAVLYTKLVLPGIIPLELLLERMCQGPALALGMPVPRIAVGAPANLVLLDLGARWQVTEAGFKSKSVNSWLLGETLQGQPRLTIAAGRVAHDLGAVPA